MFAAFFIRIDAGGLLVMKVKLLSLIDGDDHRQDVAGLLLRGGVELLAERHDVDALRPSAGPTGGAGLACPAGICSLI